MSLRQKSEHLAQWYFRLNGFFTLPNFVLHPDRKGSQRTDVDVAGVRFPFRQEFGSLEIDEPEFSSRDKLYLVLAEVKSNWVQLNDTWCDPSEGNLEDLLSAFGPFGQDEIGSAAAALRSQGIYENEFLYCSLYFIGEKLHDTALRLPQVPHRTWNEVLTFIFRRFSRYDRLKTQTEQWDDKGRELLGLATTFPDEQAFIVRTRQAFFLPAA